MTSVADQPIPASPDGKEVVIPESRGEWRAWLEAHPHRIEGVWVVFRKTTSGLLGPVYDDLVEEALCFGWIDSLTKRVDDDRTVQWYSPRRKGGIWARSNKERVERLTAQRLMTRRGQEVIDLAQADGSWTQYDDVEAMKIHGDLEGAFSSHPGARSAFEELSPSTRKQHLWWIYRAKRPQTRASRIDQLIDRLVVEP